MEPTDRFFGISEDFRDAYARDRDRIVHSKNFRLLEYKTQVFINTEGDYFRTRLTHSLEVSQIARTICKHLGLNEALAEAIALSHDLGHTPFGHIGGDELDRLMKAHGNSNGFEHNFQSFRVVTKLEKRYQGFDGLNLTFATLEGILKHSAPYRKAFLPSSLDQQFNLSLHPRLEAVIVDLSDMIAYISHDIDDGVHHGLINFEQLKASPLVVDVLEAFKNEGLEVGSDLFRYRFHSVLIHHLITDLLEHSKVEEGSIPASDPLPIRFSNETATRLKRLKKLLFQKLYRHPEVMKKMYFGQICIRKLFEAYREQIGLLPLEYKARMSNSKNPNRIIADFIASLSDRKAIELYKELYVGL